MTLNVKFATSDGLMYFYVCRSIDVRMITEVTDLPDSEQNEENSCFNIITPDRTYEIKGIDEDEKLRYGKVATPHILFCFCFLVFIGEISYQRRQYFCSDHPSI